MRCGWSPRDWPVTLSDGGLPRTTTWYRRSQRPHVTLQISSPQPGQTISTCQALRLLCAARKPHEEQDVAAKVASNWVRYSPSVWICSAGDVASAVPPRRATRSRRRLAAMTSRTTIRPSFSTASRSIGSSPSRAISYSSDAQPVSICAASRINARGSGGRPLCGRNPPRSILASRWAWSL